MTVVYVVIALVFALGIGGFLFWSFRKIRRAKKNRVEAAGKVLAEFFDPANGGSEEFMCIVRRNFFVVPPPGYEIKSKEFKEWNKITQGCYLLVHSIDAISGNGHKPQEKGAAVATKERELTVHRITTRHVWPPNRPADEQTIVDKVRYVKGDPRPRDPWNNLIPVNTDAIIKAVADAQNMEAMNAQSRWELENVEGIYDQIKTFTKYIKYFTIAVIVMAVAIFGVGILNFLTYQAIKKLAGG